MAIFKNGGNLTTGFNVSAAAPIDGRFVADYLTDLIDSAAWSNSNASQYAGLVTYVKETGKLYILHSTSGSLITITDQTTEEEKQAALSNWSPVVDQSDLSKLSGVFQFKGVAYSISEDQSVLTCGYAYIVTTEGGPSEYKQIVCKSTAYDVAGELYYSWADEDGNILFWTDSTVLNSSASQYDRQEGSFSLYYVTDGQGNKYYLNTNQPMATGGDSEGINWGQCLQFWNEDCESLFDYENLKAIYCPGGLEALNDGDTFQTVNGISYNYNEETVTVHIIKSVYTFTTKTLPYDIYTSDNGSDKPIQDGLKYVYTVLAVPENAGHVYQIQENEYASNGSIWVKLGSPVEDWVIL